MFILNPLESSLPPSPLRRPQPFGHVSRVPGRWWGFFLWSCRELVDQALPSHWVTPIATTSRFPVRIKNRVLSWPLTIFSSGNFLKKGGLSGNPQWKYLSSLLFNPHSLTSVAFCGKESHKLTLHRVKHRFICFGFHPCYIHSRAYSRSGGE